MISIHIFSFKFYLLLLEKIFFFCTSIHWTRTKLKSFSIDPCASFYSTLACPKCSASFIRIVFVNRGPCQQTIIMCLKVKSILALKLKTYVHCTSTLDPCWSGTGLVWYVNMPYRCTVCKILPVKYQYSKILPNCPAGDSRVGSPKRTHIEDKMMRWSEQVKDDDDKVIGNSCPARSRGKRQGPSILNF